MRFRIVCDESTFNKLYCSQNELVKVSLNTLQSRQVMAIDADLRV